MIPRVRAILTPCDHLCRAEMLLGEPRPFMGRSIGRIAAYGGRSFHEDWAALKKYERM